MVHTYRFPTVCQYCKKLLRGLFKQGVQCRDCQYNAHKKCIDKVPQDCTGETQNIPSELNDSAQSTNNERDSFFKDEFDDNDFDDNPTPLINFNDDQKPSNQQQKQQYHHFQQQQQQQINKINGIIDLQSSEQSSTTSSSPSTNIPLMRIVQSVKHTKKRGGQALKEGWLVHCTNIDKTIKRYFWRLDSKAVTLFVSEQGSKYHKEIPLTEIISINTNEDFTGDRKHCFEIRTANVDYYVGQDPLIGCKDEPVRLPPPESGIGTDIAKSWETTIKQALMHVTNTRTFIFFLV